MCKKREGDRQKKKASGWICASVRMAHPQLFASCLETLFSLQPLSIKDRKNRDGRKSKRQRESPPLRCLLSMSSPLRRTTTGYSCWLWAFWAAKLHHCKCRQTQRNVTPSDTNGGKIPVTEKHRYMITVQFFFSLVWSNMQNNIFIMCTVSS